MEESNERVEIVLWGLLLSFRGEERGIPQWRFLMTSNI
jgi:hypothetical protein